ncbi:cysteine peptidase C (CPC) [Trypanosoma equiperdum]|uniref:Cysteine peptidase C (CPC) n=4 Tax=Trypanozoon TaxID=39700 RepID=D6XHE1_TRYB2|nr:cysteine peptidase C (CPC) [Trypanosoma brucei brucei TREU927]4HWY_A Chain A, Cysteine peptidase C (CPC) [Trypanosoma brucei brucei TREU927]4N4Z_A Chain A, Cysteine peptidase C (CPC) [Trypanosoma brucei brucei]AAR88085.1 cathepsin B-like cysteine protease [Trypanosoma brucei]SCU67278.1 cysteine peptidase C (CPC) [Trypanosoma equiperdum]AAX80461.1 cysteine peptidase C (CPC) [Trypanosoma brucei]AAZ11620.1 cysteine peptidase C (CPC) [Trypanosoma brucei brucei TREU927]
MHLMRACITFCIASTAVVAVNAALVAEDAPVLSKAFVDRVNRLNRGIWKAKYDGVMQNITLREAKRLNGVIKKNNNASILPKRRFTEEEARAPLPSSFDSAEAWPNCPTIPQIADQSACGSCWAVAAASAMSDRFCTMGGVQDVHISAGDLLACCSDCGDGCNGGDPDRAWAYFSSTGLVSDYCQPYPFPHCSHHSKSKNGYPPCSQFNFDTPKCNYTCDDPTIPVVNYRSWTSYALQGEDDYMRELFFRGPFEVAFDVYEDFIAYNSGVYHHVSGQYLGGHAVRLVGWGTSNGVPYWKIANSWNTEWGMDGYFLIRRGSSECGIEDGGSAGIPLAPNTA